MAVARVVPGKAVAGVIVAGIDLSTKALTGALVPIDGDAPQHATFRHVTLRKPADASQLYRDIRRAVAQLLVDVEGEPVVWAVVEAPRGPYAVRQLNGVYGAVCASIPARVTYTALEPIEWRRALQLPAKLSKADAINEARGWLMNATGHAKPLTEHEADALHVARAGRRILADHYRQEVAA